MSLTSALHAANSGLNAASRGALVVADNVANVATPGYAPRSLGLSSTVLGGTGTGVAVTGVARNIDPGLLAARRSADGAQEAATLTVGFWRDLEQTVGVGEDPGALTRRIDRLGVALQDAVSRPDSDARLDAVLSSATQITTKFHEIESSIQAARLDADRQIARDVMRVNEGLEQLDALNRDITRQTLRGLAPNGLIDQRQRLIDSIAEIIPVQEVAGAHGAIRLIGPGGQMLTGSEPARFDFAPAGTVTAQNSVSTGGLSGLTLNGRAVDTSADGPLAGGRLAASFAVRDTAAPAAQDGLDALARDLIARFEAPQGDPSLPAGTPGLFIEANPAGIPAGLAGRIQVNPDADPAQGGDLWKLRSGLGATLPGPVGETRVLAAMADAMDIPQAMSPGSAQRGASGNAAAFLSEVGTERQSAENANAFSTARLQELETRLAADGVDSDAELQRLLMIEQSYAANARVIRAIDDMLRRLTEL